MGSRPDSESQVQPLPIEEFMKRATAPSDVFLRISQTKFILLLKGGAVIPVDVLEKYKAKNVAQLYVWLDDYRAILEEQLRNLDTETSPEALGKRFAVIRDAMRAVYDDITQMGFDEQQFERTKLVNHATMTFIHENPTLTNVLERMSSFTQDTVRHGLMVSVLAVMIGQRMEWEKPGTLEKLGLGGFLHDIGSLKTPVGIVNKDVSQMNRDEKVIYENHPTLGREMAAQSKTVPDDVLLIIREHHERADGTGFPDGLKDFQTSPLARVVCLANAFVDRMEKESKPFTPETTQRIYDEFRLDRAQQFNRDVLRALGRSLAIPGLRVAG